MDSKKQKRLKKLWESGKSVAEIAELLGTTKNAIYCYTYRNRDKFPLRKERALQVNHKKAKELWKEGISIKDIAQELGVSKSVIFRYIYSHRKDFPIRPGKEETLELNHERIKELWKAGMSIKDIADQFNTSKSMTFHYIYEHREDFPKRKEYVLPLKHEELKELWEKGVSVKEIAEKLRVNEIAIYSYTYQHRDDFPARQKIYRTKLQDNGEKHEC